MVNPVSKPNTKSLESALNSVTQMCQQMWANLEKQNFLITALQDKYDSQQKLTDMQGHQIEVLNSKLDCLNNNVLDCFQEAEEDIVESEHDWGWDSADQSTHHN